MPIEARCTRCHGTFVPAGTSPEDVIHGEEESGTPCGGIGVIEGEWIAPGTQAQYTETFGRMVNLSPQEKHGLEHPDCSDSDCEFHYPNPPVITDPLDYAAEKLAMFARDATAKTHREAQYAFARVDWVEPEVPENTPKGYYLEVLFNLGQSLGMLTFDELSDRERKLLFNA